MKELMLLLSGAMSRDMHVDLVERAIQSYRDNPCDETFGHLCGSCAMILGKSAIEADKDGADGVIRQMDTMRKGTELLTPKEN